MPKRRRLTEGQTVVIIYTKRRSFVEEHAEFVEYRTIEYGNVKHQIPIFMMGDEEITGLDCFWLPVEDVISQENIQRMQYELIQTQLAALEIGYSKGYEVPQKIKDKKIVAMAEQNVNRMEQLIAKLGFDPRDESWIEKELALTNSERNWFRFERENALLFEDDWVDITTMFNRKFKENVSPEQAKALNKKRQRFILGAYTLRMSGNSSVEDWKKASKEFEEKHRFREERMRAWSENHDGNYPLARTKKPVKFFPGPFFESVIEKIPHVFTDSQFTHIKEGIVLRVISYDPLYKYIRLDFTADVRKIIRPDEPVDRKPWLKGTADYDMWILPKQIESDLELLEPLE